jgi:hypothetical protein
VQILRYHRRIIRIHYILLLRIVAEALVALAIALVGAAAAVLLVGEQIHAVAATARPAVLAGLVAAAAVLAASDDVHALTAAARRPGAPRHEACFRRLLRAIVVGRTTVPPTSRKRLLLAGSGSAGLALMAVAVSVASTVRRSRKAAFAIAK